jgi:hypothetical protein
LVDARPGANQGTILEHPFISQLASRGAIPDDIFQARLAPEALTRDTVVIEDPLGQRQALAAWEGHEAYRGRWIAGSAPVNCHFGEMDATAGRDAGLRVFAVENYADAMRPSEQLSDALLRLVTWLLLTLFAVFIALVMFAMRSIRQAEARLQVRESGATEVGSTAR